MKTRFFKTIFIIILFLLFIFISSYSYANSVFNNLSSNIFRLHIVANSDSKEDQNLKLKVRDEIIKYLKLKTIDCKTKDEVINITSKNLKELQKIAIKTIKENGYEYNVKLEIGNFPFPTKYYNNVSMPARKLWCIKYKNWKSKTDIIGGAVYFLLYVLQIPIMEKLAKLLKKI